jgi:hypothetical protein
VPATRKTAENDDDDEEEKDWEFTSCLTLSGAA